MIDKRRITISVGASIVQIIVSGITVFLLYRFLLETIGPEKLGIWALVLAASSMVQAANLGMTGSIVKHIADYDALEDKRKISLAIQTAVLSIALFSLVFVVCVFPAAKYYFQFTLEDKFYHDALEILPLALISFWIFMLTSIYQGALYGCQLIAQRNGILVVDSISHFVLCVILTPYYGLLGLAYARVIQNCLTLVVTIVLLKRYVQELPVLPCRWNKRLFKEMFGYAVNFQIISLLVMLSDPVTKGFLSKYGNVSMVAYYEMANKLVKLCRSLLVNANQVLVPTFANLNQLDPKKILNTYLVSYQFVFYLAVPGFCLLAIFAPLISEIWVGNYEPVFIWSMVILCGGWLVNTLSVPAYYAGMGTGNMRDNVITHLVMTVSNIVLILIVGRLWEGLGVVVAWAVALVLGGGLLNILYCWENVIYFSNVIPKDSRWLTVLCLIGFFVGYGLQSPEIKKLTLIISASSDSWARYMIGSMMVVCFFMIVSLPMWNHPIRKKIMNLIADVRSK
jgi:O-antigen/teichoic acid export membrane protein